MTSNPSTYALTKTMDQFPEYPDSGRETTQPAAKPTYPIEHRSRRNPSD